MTGSRMGRAAALLALAGGLAAAGLQGQTAPAKPAFGAFGVDLAGMDPAVAPGDDFYAYVNGGWARATPIPADKANYGAFDALQDLSRERTRGILDAAAADGSSKIGRYYAAYLDTAAIEAKGLAPIRPWLDHVRALGSRPGYAALAGEAEARGVGGPFAAGVGQDVKAPDTYAVSLRQNGLGMPDRDYYLNPDASFAKTRDAYRAHLARMLALAGEQNADARAAAILAFETAIARVSWTRAESRDADRTYNKASVPALATSAPGFAFAVYLSALGYKSDEVVVAQPSAVTGIAALIAGAPLGVLRDQLLVRSLDAYAEVLPRAVDDERFAFFGTTLSGTPRQPARWKRAVDATEAAVTDEVSRAYVERYFPPATKAAADALVRNVIAAMDARIDRLTWMAPATKAKAHAKLAAFMPRIGYPDRWRDYSALIVAPGDAYGNLLRARQWESSYGAGKLGQPVRRWEWGMTPMTVNAQANPALVAITFPAAILQPPFFDPAADPAVNYGAIGAVIGHEMSHHFDDQGAKYDATGRLAKWWTDADIAHFTALEDRLAAQYDAYQPMPGMRLDGRLTLGENSADLAGLAAALDAYHRSLAGRPAPVIGGFTGDQRFYLGFAQIWRRSYREPDLRQRLLTDPHSPSEQRVDTLRNIDTWYAAFRPSPGQKLYLAPDQRVRIW